MTQYEEHNTEDVNNNFIITTFNRYFISMLYNTFVIEVGKGNYLFNLYHKRL